MKIGLLSDTHGFLHPRLEKLFRDADEIWHAGDIGDIKTFQKLSQVKSLRAVYGNIDGGELRRECKAELVFYCEEVKVAILHIGGYPGRYDRRALELIRAENPALFICGHSHILKVMYDEKNRLLFMNPGAAGKFGFHLSITALRFVIEGKNIKDLEVLDIPRNSEK